MTTFVLTGWIVGLVYIIRIGGPLGIIRTLRNPGVPRRYKLLLACCALPIPGPFDELVAAMVLARLATAAEKTR